METIERILAEHPFFAGLDPRYLDFLVGCASNVRFEAGMTIFREGQEADRFYLIRQGRVALEAFHLERGAIPIQTLGAGDILGWSWLVPPYRWRFDARAVETARAIALDGKCLRDKCEEVPALGYELLKRSAQVMESRLQATRTQLVDLHGTNR